MSVQNLINVAKKKGTNAVIVNAGEIFPMESVHTAPIAAKLASEDKVKIIVKGHIHTDVLMKAVLKRDLNLIGKKD